MKKIKTIFTYKNLYQAYLVCRKNKRKTINALKFEYDLENNLMKLYLELKNREYHPGRSIRFVVTEPKIREIFAADFRDRIVHHLFVRELMFSAEKRFISDSYACRKGKGTHKAVEQLRKFIKSAGQNSRPLHYGQFDIKTFFPSIDHNILFQLTKNSIKKAQKNNKWIDEMTWLARIIIYHKAAADYLYKGDPRLVELIPVGKSLTDQSPGKGLPIGNYTSQFFANLYLDKLDHYIKSVLKCRYYIRYVDDLVIIGTANDDFGRIESKINNFLNEKLALCLNQKKTKIKPLGNGIDFLGYFSKKNYTLARRSVVKRMNNKLHAPKTSKEDKMEIISSYFAHFQHADTWSLRSQIVKNQLDYIYWPESLIPGFQHRY